MNGDSSQISFIPKKPLIEDDVFIARQRPRSVLGLLAGFLFLASVGAYTGLYFYEDILLRDIQKKTAEIDEIQREISSSPEIGQAKVFNTRADLARALLSKHIIVSPIFDFLSKNTLGSIFYGDFSFRDEKGVLTLTLGGESPSYASLAYQADVFRASNDLVSFSVENIELTKSGSVSFDFKMVFNPKFLSYEKSVSESVKDEASFPATTTIFTTTTTRSISTSSKENDVAGQRTP